MATRAFGTCFFEQYAQISLSALLGSEFDCLVNMDRPDLQSPDGKSIGIEVTRAMEESKQAEMALLKDVAGITKGESDHDIDQILEYGYSFGLQGGKYIGLLVSGKRKTQGTSAMLKEASKRKDIYSKMKLFEVK